MSDENIWYSFILFYYFLFYSVGVLVDVTKNYGSAFYSCATGMGLGAVFLGLVRPAKRGLPCMRRDQKCPKATHVGQENSVDQSGLQEQDKGRDSPQDFLEVDVELDPNKERTKGNGNPVISSA